MEGEDYTIQEAAKILRITERTVRRRLERGDLEDQGDAGVVDPEDLSE